MKRTIPAAILSLLAVFASAQQKPVITVLDFKTSGVSEREMKSIISLLSNSLFKTGKFTVIDVAQREALLKEIEFSLSDCVEEICQIEIGKQLSAELIVVGSIDKIGSSLVLASKTLETQSGRTVSVADGMYHDLEELVRNIGKLGSELAGAPSTPDESKKRVGIVRRPVPPGFVLVKAGTFQMGSADGDIREKPVHSVTISRDFYMSQHEVTQKQWQQLMGNNPTKIKGSSLPVEQVTWYEAVEYCNRLSREEGLTSCYSGSGDDIACDFSADGYRIPTEAEWEYAARGGNRSQGYIYAGSSSANEVGWYRENSASTTHLVGKKRPNELGLYDLTGNVWEWCWDWYGLYGTFQEVDPQGAQHGFERVIRGGGWGTAYLNLLRLAYRNTRFPPVRDNGLGFRPVRTAE